MVIIGGYVRVQQKKKKKYRERKKERKKKKIRQPGTVLYVA